MAAEIRETPEVIRRLLTEGWDQVRDAANLISERDPKWISIVARGTSDHAAVYARYLLQTRLGIPVVLAAPSISTVYEREVTWDDGMLLAISQSGQSPDLVAVAEDARAGGSPVVAITNSAHSPLAESANIVIDCLAGPERSVAATKSYTASLTALAMLVDTLRPSLELQIRLLPETVAQTIEASHDWLGEVSIVDDFSQSTGALIVGRGFNLATALEVALKLIETSRRFAIGYSAADLAHGPMVLATEDLPVLVLDPPGPMGSHVSAVLTQAEDQGARLWSVGNVDGGEQPPDSRRLTLPVQIADDLSPIAYAIPGQLLAEAVARRLGMDPDAPHGLSKVTLTR